MLHFSGIRASRIQFGPANRVGQKRGATTTMSLQMVDRSLPYPKGIIEDVLVKVDKFIFPINFVVLDMEEYKVTPLILGRPFLSTSKALVDVECGELTLRVGDEERCI